LSDEQYTGGLVKMPALGQTWLPMLVILTTQEADIGGLQFKPSTGKKLKTLSGK
jgi:hypothetical protein